MAVAVKPPTANFLRAVQKRAAVDIAVNVVIEQIEQFLRVVGCFLSFHESAPVQRQAYHTKFQLWLALKRILRETSTGHQSDPMRMP